MGYEFPANMTEKLEWLACALLFPLLFSFYIVFVFQCFDVYVLFLCIFTELKRSIFNKSSFYSNG